MPSLEIRVPPLGESITEATIAKWHAAEGEAVAKDAPLVELETDKVTLEVNAQAAGRLASIKAAEGETVTVGALLGEIEEGAAGTEPKTVRPEAAAAEAAAPAATAAKKSAATAAKQSAATAAKEGPEPAGETAETALSPAVRKLIDEHGLKAGAIAGTGPGGRILKGDVLATLEAQAAPSVSPARPPAAPSGPRPESAREERVRMSRLRKRIAERLKEAQQSAAMLTTFNECDMTSAMALRARHREAFEKKHGVKLGFMSFFVKACIQALREIPAANAEIDGDDIVYKNYYHIGVAVSAPQGLVVPVLRDADRLSFAEIEKAIAELGRRARDGKLDIADLSGGTFTISNGGIFGSLMSTPILNPPQSAILGMHKIMERPVVEAGAVVARPMMYLALSYDHRLIDGREAVTFLVRVKESLEHPERLLFDL